MMLIFLSLLVVFFIKGSDSYLNYNFDLIESSIHFGRKWKKESSIYSVVSKNHPTSKIKNNNINEVILPWKDSIKIDKGLSS